MLRATRISPTVLRSYIEAPIVRLDPTTGRERGVIDFRSGITVLNLTMLEPLANRIYRHLFAAQIVALIGTGLATVALGLLAFQLAGSDAGAVLGTALAIKMIAYVGVAPIAGAAAQILPRRAFLVVLDLIRAVVALSLPFVDQVWQVYLLIFVLQSASAAFAPTFQARLGEKHARSSPNGRSDPCLQGRRGW